MNSIKLLLSFPTCLKFFVTKPCMFLEYATVGYMAKRIQMRKNRFLAIQKIAEKNSKQGLDGPHPPGVPGDHSTDHPKQTVSMASTLRHNSKTCAVS